MHIGWDAFYKMHLTRCIDGYSEVGIGWEWTNEVYILRWYVQWNDNNYLHNLWYIKRDDMCIHMIGSKGRDASNEMPSIISIESNAKLHIKMNYMHGLWGI